MCIWFNSKLKLLGTHFTPSGSPNKSTGIYQGVYEPHENFLSNIPDYLQDRFLDIGRAFYVFFFTRINITSMQDCTPIICGCTKSSCLCWKNQSCFKVLWRKYWILRVFSSRSFTREGCKMEDKSCREVWREKECHIYWRSLQEDGLRASSQSEVWLQPGGSCLLQQSFSDLQVDFAFWDFKKIFILFLMFSF